ncbi:unnamed protein product [Echinostoma caproni]|uniref:Uncharacterized protein n=1 Tax=Echinostoma caproni TaxID=27848 RepID=A0A183A3U4_9TREM|nr:unnamed protein product [Echinostoma caproni]
MATEESEISMHSSADQFQLLLMQQQKQMEAQLKLIESLTQRLNLQTTESVSREISSSATEMLANSITELSYDPETGHIFEACFKRWEDVFRIDFICEDDAWKVRLRSENLELLNTPDLLTKTTKRFEI